MNLIKCIRKRYSDIPKEGKASLWYTICNFLVKAISLITVPIFTRVLSETDYGIVSVYYGWDGIILIIGTLNLFYSSYNTALIRFKKDIYRFTSSMIGLIYLISLILIVVYFLNEKAINNFIGLSSFFIFLIITELYTVPAYNFWMSRERFLFRYQRVVLVTIAVAVSSPFISLIFTLLASTDKGFYKVLGASLPNIMVGLLFSVLFIRKGKTLFNKEYWVYGLMFNIPLIPHYLSGVILNQSDRIMISKYISMDKAGIYSIAYSASFTISILTSAINQSLVPWMYQCMQKKKYNSIKKRTCQILFCLASILLLFILIVPEVIAVLAPPSYREAIGILPVLVISVYFQFLYGLFGTVDFYFANSIYPMIASLTAALVNILGNYYFLPRYGYFAAGYTTLASYIAMTLMHYLLMRVVLKNNGINDSIFDIKKITIISLMFAIAGYLESLIYTMPIFRCTVVFIGITLIVLKRNKILLVLRK